MCVLTSRLANVLSKKKIYVNNLHSWVVAARQLKVGSDLNYLTF